MNRSILGPVLEVASEARHKAHERLAGAQNRCMQAQNTLDTLLSYRKEYEQNWCAVLGNGVSHLSFDTLQAFLSRLDTAINQQREALARCTEQSRIAQTILNQATIREQAIEVLIRRDALARQAIEKKRDQRTTDECAARLARSDSLTTNGFPGGGTMPDINLSASAVSSATAARGSHRPPAKAADDALSFGAILTRANLAPLDGNESNSPVRPTEASDPDPELACPAVRPHKGQNLNSESGEEDAGDSTSPLITTSPEETGVSTPGKTETDTPGPQARGHASGEDALYPLTDDSGLPPSLGVPGKLDPHATAVALPKAAPNEPSATLQISTGMTHASSSPAQKPSPPLPGDLDSPSARTALDQLTTNIGSTSTGIPQHKTAHRIAVLSRPSTEQKISATSPPSPPQTATALLKLAEDSVVPALAQADVPSYPVTEKETVFGTVTDGISSPGTAGSTGSVPDVLSRLLAPPVTQASSEMGPHATRQIAPSDFPVLPKIDDPAWGLEIANTMGIMVRDEILHAELILTPPEIGRLEILIELKGDRATADFASADPAVRTMLEDSLSSLRERLQEVGLNLGEAFVRSEMPSGRQESPYRPPKWKSPVGTATIAAADDSGPYKPGKMGSIDTFA